MWGRGSRELPGHGFAKISEKPHVIENSSKYSASLHERFCVAKSKQNKNKNAFQ